MDNVEVVGVFNADVFRKTLEALVSRHFHVEATLKAPRPSGRRVRPATGESPISGWAHERRSGRSRNEVSEVPLFLSDDGRGGRV